MKSTKEIMKTLVEEAHSLTPRDEQGTNDGLLIDAIIEAIERLDLYGRILVGVWKAMDLARHDTDPLLKE